MQRLRDAYQKAGSIFLGVAIAFVVLNVFLFSLIKVREIPTAGTNPISRKYDQPLGPLYDGFTDEEINDLLFETWSRPMEFEPFTQFRESQFSGNYVNVDENGFRRIEDQGPWPPQDEFLNVFVFGGSTTFGYGLPDEQTIVSFLQEILSANGHSMRVRVYNFGRGFYYSSQERILFEKLLVSGNVPDLAIFVDGLNDFIWTLDEPQFTDVLTRMMELNRSRKDMLVSALAYWLPVGRAGLYMGEQLAERSIGGPAPPAEEASMWSLVGTEGRARAVVERYLLNKKLVTAVASSFDVNTLFVWQPIPVYEYDRNYYPFDSEGFEHFFADPSYGYLLMREYVADGSLGSNFLWLAEIQRDIQEPLYVDQAHYNARLSRLLAQEIGDFIVRRSLLEGDPEAMDSQLIFPVLGSN